MELGRKLLSSNLNRKYAQCGVVRSRNGVQQINRRKPSKSSKTRTRTNVAVRRCSADGMQLWRNDRKRDLSWPDALPDSHCPRYRMAWRRGSLGIRISPPKGGCNSRMRKIAPETEISHLPRFPVATTEPAQDSVGPSAIDRAGRLYSGD